jgi:hypothetical protein
MQQAVQAGAIPGLVLALGDRHGGSWDAGFGSRAVGSAEPMQPDAVFWIASMTKAITGAAVMMLVEAGKLSLDAPANALVPGIGALGVLEGYDEAGQPKLRPAKRPITLRHLLTHTSGYAYDMWSADIARFRKATGTPAVGTCRNAALALPLLFDPGEDWSYGIGIDWAGKMIEAATGETLGAHLARAGHEVLLVDTVAEHVEACRTKGLTISGPVTEFTQIIPAVTPAELTGRYSRIVLAVKAQATKAALPILAPHLAPDGFVFSAQNGLNELEIASSEAPIGLS